MNTHPQHYVNISYSLNSNITAAPLNINLMNFINKFVKFVYISDISSSIYTYLNEKVYDMLW